MLQQLAGRVSVSPVAAAACAAAATTSPCEAAADERHLDEFSVKRDFCSAASTPGPSLAEGAVTEARPSRETCSTGAGPLMCGSKSMREDEGPSNACSFSGKEWSGASQASGPPWPVKVESASVCAKGFSEREENRWSSGIGGRVSPSSCCASSSKAFLRGGHVPSQEALHAELATFELLTQLRVVARRWALHQDNFFFHWNRLRFEWRARSGMPAGSVSCTKPEEDDSKASLANGDRRSPSKPPLQHSGCVEDSHLRAAEPASDSVDTLCSFLPKFWSQKRSTQGGTLFPAVAAVLQQLDARRRALDESYIPLGRFLAVPSPRASSPAVSRLGSGVSRQETTRTLSDELPCEAQRIVMPTEPRDRSNLVSPVGCADHASSSSSSSSSCGSSSTLAANILRPSSATAYMAPYFPAPSGGSAAAAATTRALHAAAGLTVSPSWTGSCGPWGLCGGAGVDDPTSKEACCGSSGLGRSFLPGPSAAENGNVASTALTAEASSYQCLVQQHRGLVRLRPSSEKPCCTACCNSSSSSSQTEGSGLAAFARRRQRVCIRKAGDTWTLGPQQTQQHEIFSSQQTSRDVGGPMPTELPPAAHAAPCLLLHPTAPAAPDRSRAVRCCLGGAGGLLQQSTSCRSNTVYFGRQSEEGASVPAQQTLPPAAAAAAAAAAVVEQQHEPMWEDGPLKRHPQPLQQHCGFSAVPPAAAKAAAVCNDLQQRHEQLREGAAAQQQQHQPQQQQQKQHGQQQQQQQQQQHLGTQRLQACMQPQMTGTFRKVGVDDPHRAKSQQQEQSVLQQHAQQQQQQRVQLAGGNGGEASFTSIKRAEAIGEGERGDVEGPITESEKPQSTPAVVCNSNSSSSSSFEGASIAKASRKVNHIVVEDGGLRLSFVARKGVYYDKRRRLWRANWKENGRIHTKGFSVHDYSSHQVARQKAIEFRESKEQEIELYLQPVLPSPKAAGNPLMPPPREASSPLLQPPLRMQSSEGPPAPARPAWSGSC
ncbi:hypothetical protein Emag_000385 [Eimeria magna]